MYADCMANDALIGGFARLDLGYEVRAMNTGERGVMKFQIRHMGLAWPPGWVVTTDLAESLGALGFDKDFKSMTNKRFRFMREVSRRLREGGVHAYPYLDAKRRRLLFPSVVLMGLVRTLRWLRNLGMSAGGVGHDIPVTAGSRVMACIILVFIALVILTFAAFAASIKESGLLPQPLGCNAPLI